MQAIVPGMAGTQREPGAPQDPQSDPAPRFAEPTMRFERPSGSLLGSLLVATPALVDPSFERTVVLLVAHEPGGAMGVVLNRATEVPVSEVLGGWGGLAREPAVLFEGGPVQPESAICVARMRRGGDEPPGFQPFYGQLGTVDLGVEPDHVRERIEGMRVFAGYAGWASGQLEAEIEAGSWFTFDALPGDPFMTRPDDLWTMVLRRQGGMLAAVAHYPPDPSMN
jgi:putative transcriptional regulator